MPCSASAPRASRKSAGPSTFGSSPISHKTIAWKTACARCESGWLRSRGRVCVSARARSGFVPSWEERERKQDELVVVLEPGAAFGTGGHATSRLCLRGLVQHLRPGDRVADVGCGSGILAITAAVLGASAVVATENDRAALSVAQANAKRNAVADQIRFVEADLLSGISGPFDLVVCNIVAEEVIRLAEGLPALLGRGGRCITSGFVAASIPRVEDALSQSGLQTLETPSEEGWAACIAARPDRGR